MSKDERIKATRCGRSALKAASYREWTAMNDFLMELWGIGHGYVLPLCSRLFQGRWQVPRVRIVEGVSGDKEGTWLIGVSKMISTRRPPVCSARG